MNSGIDSELSEQYADEVLNEAQAITALAYIRVLSDIRQEISGKRQSAPGEGVGCGCYPSGQPDESAIVWIDAFGDRLRWRVPLETLPDWLPHRDIDDRPAVDPHKDTAELLREVVYDE